MVNAWSDARMSTISPGIASGNSVREQILSPVNFDNKVAV